jgi:hypothetical protein
MYQPSKQDFDNTLAELRYARGRMVRYGLRPPRRCGVCAAVEDEHTLVVDGDGMPVCEHCVMFAQRRLDRH